MFENILSEAWKNILTGELISFTYEELKKTLKKNNRNLLTKEEDYKNSFNTILTEVLNWAGFIPSIGLYSTNNELLTHYIEMDYYIIPVKYQYKKIDSSKNLIDKLSLDNEKNLVVFGLPGMGKTTSMKMVAYKIISDSTFLNKYFAIPFVVRLREFKNNFSADYFVKNPHKLLFVHLANMLNIRPSIIDEKLEKEYKDSERDFVLLKNFVISTINNLKAILIIDGFDELELGIRDTIFDQVKEISLKTSNVKILLTSRTGEFKYNIENFHYYELAPLTNEQIKTFSKKWLGDKYLSFISKLEGSSFLDTAIRPLILSFLCLIYKHTDELPNQPKFIYKEIIDLLLDRWDKERYIPRKSKFSNFNKNQKLDFITDLAFFLTIESKYYFSKYDIQMVYVEIAEIYELDSHNFQDVIDEIEEHSGIFIQSGADSYEFPHKSIQEFLAAEYLVRYSSLSKFTNEFHRIPSELAIVVALCKNPREYLVNILLGLSTLEINIYNKFLAIFLTRLLSEKPVFKPDIILSLDICEIIELFWTKHKYENFEFFNSLFNLKGIKESFELLDLKYSCEPELIHNLMNGKKYEMDEIITINKNDLSTKYIIYFKFVTNWRYVRPYLNF